VIGLSGLLLFGAALGLAVDQEKIIDALLVCMALWGLATGIGLLRLRPWARLSSLVFYSCLCISGAFSVAYIVVRISTSPSGSISTESVRMETVGAFEDATPNGISMETSNKGELDLPERGQ
jgi:hypothetical protein